MMTFSRAVLAALLAALILLAAVAGVVVWRLDSETAIAKHSWLHLDLYGDLPEYDPPTGLIGALGGGGQTLQSVLTNLEMAAVDKRIDGVVLQLSAALKAGNGKLEEVRAAVQHVRAAGKPVLAYADNIDLKVIYAAAACDSFFCPPPAYIECRGIDRVHPHVKTMLAKLGIEPQVSALREYKSAAQIVTRTDLTPEARANAEWILADVMDIYKDAITAGRPADSEGIDAWMENAMFTAGEAEAAGIVDRVLYWDELVARCIPDGKEDPRLVSGGRYAGEDPEDLGLGGDRKIAVIHAQGNIGGRENAVNPLLGLMMGHETINREIERALRDDDVVGIVLRVDSGGGESLASDLMGHEVELASRKKPIVISMVDVAASGGYMMSYRASYILADAMTITGSIGSISAKFDMSGFDQKVGLQYSHVELGPNARLMSSDRPFSAAEFELFHHHHEVSFQEWIDDVARARHLTIPEVEGLAMGRVWTGRQAVDNGLIDEVGGLSAAVAAARRLAGVESDTKTALWHLPVKQDLLHTVLGGDEKELTAAGRWLLRASLSRDLEMIHQSLVSENWQTIDPVFTK